MPGWNRSDSKGQGGRRERLPPPVALVIEAAATDVRLASTPGKQHDDLVGGTSCRRDHAALRRAGADRCDRSSLRGRLLRRRGGGLVLERSGTAAGRVPARHVAGSVRGHSGGVTQRE